METIMITEEQKDNIAKELSRLKKILEKDRGIDCVYFSFFVPYTRKSGSALVITLVTNTLDSYFVNHLGFYNKEYAQDVNYLFNAEILLDKSGVCTKIKREMEKNEPSLNEELGIHYFPNLAEIYPPLEEKAKTKSSNLVKKKTR